MATMERWQQVISQNIAASSVPGYKKTELSVDGLDFGTLSSGKTRSSSTPAVMPQDSTTVSFDRGTMTQTRNPTDVAIGAEGFFEVQEASGKLRYTRNGEFNISPSGQLISSSGDVVQGQGGAITLANSGGPLSINGGGQVYQGQELVGALKVVNFADTSKLMKVSNGFYADGAAEPSTVADPKISQGYLEASNVSGVSEMINLIKVSRAQEANQKVITSYDDRLSRVITTFTR